VNLAAAYLSARAARRLRRRDPGHAAQQRIYRRLVSRLAATSAGREAGIEAGMHPSVFRARVPLRTYEAFSPYIDRMRRGERDVLWPGSCSFFAISSGTAAGRQRHLPVTEDMLAHFRSASLQSLLQYTARAGHTGIFLGRHLLLGCPATLVPIGEAQPQACFAGDLCGIAAVNFPGWAEKHYFEPGIEIACMEDWQARLAAIAQRTLRRDITLLASTPFWALPLADAVRTLAARGKATAMHLKAVWPNLECFVHGGAPLAPFGTQLRDALGEGVEFHEVYPASEGFIAAQDSEAVHGMRLLTASGLYFEFLAMDDFHAGALQDLGGRAVPLEGVRAGVDYALVLTTPAGLSRYLVGDVVRFISTDVPRLIVVGRTDLQLNAFGERVMERDVNDVLLAVCQRHGWSAAGFHVAPHFSSRLTGQPRGSHEWWIELKVPTIETPTANVIGPELDAELARISPAYAARRRAQQIEAPSVRLVMPGVFEEWMRKHGRWDGRKKLCRCRSDRLFADELTDLYRLYVGTRSPFSASPNPRE